MNLATFSLIIGSVASVFAIFAYLYKGMRFNGQFNVAARPIKIYPQEKFQLIRIPPPPEFTNVPNLVRVPAIKRITYDRRGANGMNLPISLIGLLKLNTGLQTNELDKFIY